MVVRIAAHWVHFGGRTAYVRRALSLAAVQGHPHGSDAPGRLHHRRRRDRRAPHRAAQRLLPDFLRDCRGAGSEPRRVVLTFAPCGREKTLAFLRWLGVNVAPDTERAILGAARPLAKSIEICRDNLRRILDEPYAGEIPLGVNVESVSINRDEIDAGIDLFHALRAVLAGK